MVQICSFREQIETIMPNSFATFSCALRWSWVYGCPLSSQNEWHRSYCMNTRATVSLLFTHQCRWVDWRNSSCGIGWTTDWRTQKRRRWWIEWAMRTDMANDDEIMMTMVICENKISPNGSYYSHFRFCFICPVRLWSAGQWAMGIYDTHMCACARRSCVSMCAHLPFYFFSFRFFTFQWHWHSNDCWLLLLPGQRHFIVIRRHRRRCVHGHNIASYHCV